MKTLGIIAEYNPFHNGHKYHIEKAKQITNSDFVIVIMSGSFTQQGNIAIYNKFDRAKVAINNGADLVIELPTIYANSSSVFFAKGAISLLNSLNIVDSLCFGSECGDIKILEKISNNIIANEKTIWDDISFNLKSGISFAKAREQSITKYLSGEEILEFSKPNNILAIEYLNNLSKCSSNIIPYTILREASDFKDTTIDYEKEFTSATSIRENIYNKENLAQLDKFVPLDMKNIIDNISPTYNDNLLDILKFKIITSSSDQLANIQDVTEGLENRIISSVSNCSTYSELIHNIKSKRYQMSKIKRALNNIILNITKDEFDLISNSNENYAHILAMSEEGKLLLSKLSQKSNTPVITSLNDKVLDNLSLIQQNMIKYDILSSNIHSIINNEQINKDYTNKL